MNSATSSNSAGQDPVQHIAEVRPPDEFPCTYCRSAGPAHAPLCLVPDIPKLETVTTVHNSAA